MIRCIILLIILLLIPNSYAQNGVEKFKIGMILPLSGSAADYGTSIVNCVKLAQADNPALFTNIEFLYEDAQIDPKQAISAFQKLVSANDVDLIYTFSVPFCKVLAPIAEAMKKPLVAQCIDKVSTYDKKYVLRFMNYTDEYLQTQVLRLKKLGQNKIGIVLAEHPYIEEMHASLERNLLDGQTLKVIDSYQVEDNNFRTAISKIKKENYDVVGVFLFLNQVSQFYRQAREQNLVIPTFGTNIFESISELKLAKGSMKGAEFANNAVFESFSKRYDAKYNNVSQLGFGALAYEFSTLAGKLFNNSPRDLDGAEILSRFHNIIGQKGTAAGPYEYRNTTEGGQYFYFPIVIKQVLENDFKVIP